jgi:acyl-CoA dehydrogenase
LPEPPEPGAGYRTAVVGAAAAASGPRTLWRNLGRAGLLPPVWAPPGTCGNVDPARLGELLGELDARLPPGLVLSVCVQVATAIPVLRAASGDSPLAGKVLADALRGDAIMALAATDAAVSGSALLEARTELRDDGDELVLSGGKDWIVNADCCDFALVLARHSPARHFTSFSWVLVPAGHAGVSCQPAATALFPGAGLGHLRFDDVRLDRQHVVGRRGRALAEFARCIGAERLAGALWARAMCRRVLRGTRDYLRGRKTGEATLWDNAAVRERFARCLVDLRRLDALCGTYGALPSGAADGMVLKAAYAESADRILGECVNLRGADSFRDGGLATLRAQAEMFGIAGGATGAMLAGVAEHADELLRSAG